MKNIKYILILILFVSFFTTNCKKDSENLSQITIYPIFDYKGEHFNSIPVGGSYTDPGVTATLEGQDWQVQKTGSVDFNTPGVYQFVYTTINKDNIPLSEYRYIGVIAPDAAAKDISGSYTRTANGAPVTVTKVADGLYLDDNVGGVLPTPDNIPFVVPVYFFHTTGDNIIVPSQKTSLGTVKCINTALTDTTFSWIVINGSFGRSTRVFQKN